MMKPSHALRAAIALALLGVLLASGAWATSNLNLSKSNINRINRGNLVTASVDVVGQVSSLVYTTPTNADFVLTNVCAGPVNGGTLVQVGGVKLLQIAGNACQSFNPGMLLPPGASVSCTSFDAEATSFCTITGMQGLPFPATPTP